jgi:protein-S-isoprenylcysteine O-methyltransferase Ste14
MDDLDLSAVAAFLLYGATTAALLLGARSFQQMPTTGRSRFPRLTGRRLSRAERAGRLCLGLAILAGLLSPLLAAAHLLPVYAHTEDTVGQNPVVGDLDWLGLAVSAAAIALACLAQQTPSSSWPAGVDPAHRTGQATHGIFAIVRNPILTAMVALQVGVTLIAPTWLAIAGVAAAVLASQIQTWRVEEPYLPAARGQAHLSNAARTGRFLPALGRLPTQTAEAPVPAQP